MRRRLAIVVAAAMVVGADILLVVLATQHGRGDESSSVASVSTADPLPAYVDRPVLLTGAAGGTVLRATRGDCGGPPPSLEMSIDGGSTFEPVADGEDVTSVLRVVVESRRDAWFVGSDADCSLAVYRTEDSGVTWQRSRETGGTWYPPLAHDERTVHSPAGWVSTGCVPRALSPVDESIARVLCRGGQLLGTNDAGHSWDVLGALSDATSVVYVDARTGFALATRPACSAAVLRTDDGGGDWIRSACLDGMSPYAIGGQKGMLLAQVDDRVFHSGDGSEWVRP